MGGTNRRRVSPGADAGGAESDDEMMRLVAELYYLRDHSQPAIAALTGFSVSKVSRLLAQARETGIVRISVDEGRHRLKREERRLADALRLRTAHITPARSHASVLNSQLCGVAAGPWVSAQLPEAGVVGIAAGHTVAALVDAIVATSPRPDLTLVPLVGGWDPSSPELDANETVRRAANRLQCSYRLLHAPGFLDSLDVKRALLTESSVRLTTEYWERLDMALVGIGGPPSANPGYRTVMDRLGETDRERLTRKGVVGDLVGHAFTVDGELPEDELSDRTIAASVDLLRRVPHVIAIAAGAHKVDSVIGAARTGVIGTLITDQITADGVLHRLGPLPAAHQ